ncbi:hypothetical protein F4780DRAFT_235493 [Xylariomycetidae sp. FL0641]|nr:hypothetical protein F4780DRAFT_235493 [Xylariomycetidae sp. FL0641]
MVWLPRMRSSIQIALISRCWKSGVRCDVALHSWELGDGCRAPALVLSSASKWRWQESSFWMIPYRLLQRLPSQPVSPEYYGRKLRRMELKVSSDGSSGAGEAGPREPPMLKKAVGKRLPDQLRLATNDTLSWQIFANDQQGRAVPASTPLRTVRRRLQQEREKGAADLEDSAWPTGEAGKGGQAAERLGRATGTGTDPIQQARITYPNYSDRAGAYCFYLSLPQRDGGTAPTGHCGKSSRAVSNAIAVCNIGSASTGHLKQSAVRCTCPEERCRG